MMQGNYFFSKTSAQSPSSVTNQKDRLPVSNKIFHTPGNALRLEYINGKSGKWSASIYRESLRGQDHFKLAKYFSFSIYVETPNTTQQQCPAFQLIYKDSSLSEKRSYKISSPGKWETVFATCFT